MSSSRNIPASWVIANLQDVVEIHDDLREPVNADERAKRVGPYPYYGATGQVGCIDGYLMDGEYVLLGEDGAPFFDPSKSKAYRVTGKCWVNNHAHVLRGIEGVMDNRYLMHALNQVDYRGFANGTTRLKLTQASMRQIPIPVAPHSEQVRIATKIEELFSDLDAGAAALERAKANLKRYRAAVLKAACKGRLVPIEAKLAKADNRPYETADELLQHILKERHEKWNGKGNYKEPSIPNCANLSQLPEGWTWCISEAVFTFITSGSRGWAQYYSDSGASFLRIGNLNHENIRLDLADIQHVTPPAGAEGTRTVVQGNDVLISITADVGMVAVVPSGFGEAYINQHVALARPVTSVCPSYIAYYLCSSEGGRRYLRRLQRGATKVGLGLNDIRAVPIPLPPLAEQKRIVAEVERRLSLADQLDRSVNENLIRVERLRQSILAAAFAGRLVPQDPSDEPASVLLERIKSQQNAISSAVPERKISVRKR